jgi:acyl-CoA reductase-like NAD-dependent aldehyde dehydrogenase
VVKLLCTLACDEPPPEYNARGLGTHRRALYTGAHSVLHALGRLETGICHINGATVADEAQMPFGGVKASGYGRFGGRAVIAEFTDLRWITIEGKQHYPF